MNLRLDGCVRQTTISPVRVLVMGVWPVLSGCASVLSTFTPAPTTPPGSVRGAAAIGVSAPVGQLVDVVDQGEEIARKRLRGEPLNAEEQDELVESGLTLALNPPSAAGELQGRYGVAEAIDVGVRFASSLTARVDGRFQFLKSGAEDGSGFAGSAGLGLGYYAKSFELPNADIEAMVAVASMRRVELDAPILFGFSGPVGHFWFGPKFVVNRFWADVTLEFLQTAAVAGSATGTTFFYGGQVGGAVGYKYVWLAAELSIMGLSSSADVESSAYNADLSLGGLVLYPALGVIVQI